MAVLLKIRRFRTKQGLLSIVFWAFIQEMVTDVTSIETNLALAKPTNQSSSSRGTLGSSSNAVDGISNGNFNNGSCSTTEANATIHWWMVDLEGIYTIRSVRITNRNDCCSNQLSGFSIEVSEKDPKTLTGFPGKTNVPICTTVTLYVPKSPRFPYACDEPLTGRYVRVIKPSKTHNNPLTLCEFEVYEDNVYVTPSPPDRPNLALGKPAYQSSIYSTGDASKAVDGSLDGHWLAQSCIHTKPDNLHWWMVDLEDEYVIDKVGIVNRHDCCNQKLKEFVVEISQENPSNKLSGFPHRTNASVCVTVNHPVPIPYVVYYDCVQPLKGRYVRVVKNGEPLNICEFQVFGVEPSTEPPVIITPRNGDHGHWTFSHVKSQGAHLIYDALLCLSCARRSLLHKKSLAERPFVQIDSMTGECFFLTNITKNHDRPDSNWMIYKLTNL